MRSMLRRIQETIHIQPNAVELTIAV